MALPQKTDIIENGLQLTDRDCEVLRFILEYQKEHKYGFSPTHPEVVAHFAFSSQLQSYRHAKRLREAGLLVTDIRWSSRNMIPTERATAVLELYDAWKERKGKPGDSPDV